MYRDLLGLVLGTLVPIQQHAMATVVDLSVDTNGTINGGIFERLDRHPAGTGNINSFVRIQTNDAVEEGYNTSGRPLPFDENSSPNYTRNLQVSDVPVRTFGGVDYYEFLLDINQTNSDPLLSLDALKIYTSDTGSQTTTNLASLGTLRYDLDQGGDSFVRIDYSLDSGSGHGDMRFLLPTTAFTGVTPNQFVYLYSMFGANNANNDGYEEWNVQGGGATIVPLAPAAAMASAGLLALGLVRRRA